MTTSITTTENRVATETIATEEKKTSVAEICFGALMGIGAIAGMWGAVSLMISYFAG